MTNTPTIATLGHDGSPVIIASGRHVEMGGESAMTHRQIARESAIERWNVGYARDWDDIEGTTEVMAALEFQAVSNDWEIDPAQLEADAEVIADWLEAERTR